MGQYIYIHTLVVTSIYIYTYLAMSDGSGDLAFGPEYAGGYLLQAMGQLDMIWVSLTLAPKGVRICHWPPQVKR